MSLQAQLFRLISRTATALYRVFPIYGHLPGAIGIIRRGEKFVVIDRSDGFGLSFPGGLARKKEDPVETLWREVEEETGLIVSSSALRFSYMDESLYPIETYVFEAQANGHLRSSWEGEAKLVTFDELRAGIVVSQRQAVAWIEKQTAQDRAGSTKSAE